MVIWLIGMSASGKTTIGKNLYNKLKLSDEPWFFLDGDTFRNILGEDLGHTIEDREKNAYRISRFCNYLNLQGINVLACVLSLFHENQKYNKENISNYKEIYIDVDFEVIVKRDNKELYRKALDGEIKDVVGVDIEFRPPYASDIVINNNAANSDFNAISTSIIRELKICVKDHYLYTTNNLLTNPHKYEYSIVEGESFFNKYFSDRDNARHYLEQRLNRFEKDSCVELPLVSGYIQNENIIFKDYLQLMLNVGDEGLSEEKTTVDILIKRFEVSKKLYSTYDRYEIRKSTSDYSELINYSLFSLLLQKYYYATNNDKEKLIYFNAILKVNDILSSVKEELIHAREIDYSIRAFIGEVDIARKYV